MSTHETAFAARSGSPARPGSTIGGRARSAVEAATVFFFALALCAPIADQLVRPVAARDPAPENRLARPMPGVPRTLAGLSAFPAEFERHHADTFGLRDELLRWNTLSRISLFGISPTELLVVDRSGWITYDGESVLDVLRGTLPMTPKQLEEWRVYFERSAAFCAHGRAEYLFLVCPNKETIYPDHVPEHFRPLGPSRLDQLLAGLPDDLSDRIIDPRAAMRAARAEDRPPGDHLYNVHGTHWNGRGLWVAYEEVMRALARTWPDVPRLSRKDVRFEVRGPTDDTWSRHLYVPGRFTHAAIHPAPVGTREFEVIEQVRGVMARWRTHNRGMPGPRVLVFHDSFGPLLGELLAHSLPDLLMVHSWLDPELVIVEQPDVVLEVRVERIFGAPPLWGEPSRVMLDHDLLPPEEGRLVLAVDATSPDEALLTLGPARLLRTAEGLDFRVETPRAGWKLPPFNVAPGERAWLHVELQSSARGKLAAYRRSPETGAWLRRDASFLPFTSGRNERTIALPGPDGTREIRVQLFDAPRVLVRRLEVRVSGP